jgi:predicted thioesterase
METRGIVHGKQVELEDVVPGLDGKRVRVRLELLEAEKVLSPAEQTQAWRRWIESGPQGPIEDDADGWP